MFFFLHVVGYSYFYEQEKVSEKWQDRYNDKREIADKFKTDIITKMNYAVVAISSLVNTPSSLVILLSPVV